MEDDMFSDDDEDRVPVVRKLRMGDSSLTGRQQARELANGHPGQFFQKLAQQCQFGDGYSVTAKEKLFLYLQMVAKGYAFRDQWYIWQRGAGTAVSYGEEVMRAILTVKDEYIRQPTLVVPTHI